MLALIGLALSAYGGQEANKTSESSGASAATNGQIAFRRWFDPDQTEGALFTMNPDGSHVRQITHPPKGWRDDNPAWSPDGQRVAFQRQRIDESTSRIMVVNPDTGDAREGTQCTGRCFSDFAPAFSPDGRSIAFNRAVGPPFLKGVPHLLIGVRSHFRIGRATTQPLSSVLTGAILRSRSPLLRRSAKDNWQLIPRSRRSRPMGRR